MIKFKKVTYQNFLSVGDRPITIDLDSHQTTVVSGANGTGKSASVTDTIFFALFGKPYRNINKPNLVNSINNGKLLVTLEFETKGKQYSVVRGIKPNVFEIWEDGVMLSQNAENRDFQEHLEQNILGGMNEKVFKQVVIVASTNFVPFMQLSAAQRREIIEELLDIKIFSVMSEVLKIQNSEKKKIFDTLSAKIDGLKEKAIWLKEQKDKNDKLLNTQINEQEEIIKENKLKIEENEQKIVKLKSDINDLNCKKKEIDYELFKKRTNTLQELSITKKNNIKSIEFLRHNDKCQQCLQNISDDFKKDIIDRKEQKNVEIDSAYTRLNEAVQAIESVMDHNKKIEGSVNSLHNEVDALQRDIVSKTNLIASIERNMSTIKQQKADDDIDSQLKEVKISYKNVKADYDVVDEELTYLSASLKLLKDGGVKTQVIKEYIPLFNQYINEYLDKFGLPIQFTLDESFGEVIKSRYRDKFQYNNFSEGEKQRIDIALLLTWRKIAKLKNTINTNLLILDEVMDGHLDMDAREQLSEILLQQQSDINIFVISHISGEELSSKFDSTITFTKKNNFTQMDRK